MNIVEWAPLIAVIFTVVGSAGAICYKMGKIEQSIKTLVGSVDTLNKAFKKCDDRLDEHDRRLDRHSLRIEQLSEGEK